MRSLKIDKISKAVNPNCINTTFPLLRRLRLDCPSTILSIQTAISFNPQLREIWLNTINFHFTYLFLGPTLQCLHFLDHSLPELKILKLAFGRDNNCTNDAQKITFKKFKQLMLAIFFRKSEVNINLPIVFEKLEKLELRFKTRRSVRLLNYIEFAQSINLKRLKIVVPDRINDSVLTTIEDQWPNLEEIALWSDSDFEFSADNLSHLIKKLKCLKRFCIMQWHIPELNFKLKSTKNGELKRVSKETLHHQRHKSSPSKRRYVSYLIINKI